MGLAVMVDLESLNITPDTCILTIGAVVFEPKSTGIIERIEIRPSIDEQLQLGRTISEDTVEWWGKQSPEAQEEAFGDHGRIPFKDAMERFYQFCLHKHTVWSNGASFDVVVMENALQQVGKRIPWAYYNVRDTRTLYDATGLRLGDGGHVTSHKAVEDAEHQAVVVQAGYKKLIDAGLVKPLKVK